MSKIDLAFNLGSSYLCMTSCSNSSCNLKCLLPHLLSRRWQDFHRHSRPLAWPLPTPRPRCSSELQDCNADVSEVPTLAAVHPPPGLPDTAGGSSPPPCLHLPHDLPPSARPPEYGLRPATSLPCQGQDHHHLLPGPPGSPHPPLHPFPTLSQSSSPSANPPGTPDPAEVPQASSVCSTSGLCTRWSLSGTLFTCGAHGSLLLPLKVFVQMAPSEVSLDCPISKHNLRSPPTSASFPTAVFQGLVHNLTHSWPLT